MRFNALLQTRSETQKFHYGDHVEIFRSHERYREITVGNVIVENPSPPSGDYIDAIVMGSYEDQFGGRRTTFDNPRSYTLFIKGEGEVSWYYEYQLTLIAKDRKRLLTQWKYEVNQEIRQKSDLDWIFSNGSLALHKKYICSVAALAQCFGCTEIWGNRGEGIDLAENIGRTLFFAQEFLINNDKAGWLAKAAKLKPRLVPVCHRGLIDFYQDDSEPVATIEEEVV
jgi:hypothetical protein